MFKMSEEEVSKLTGKPVLIKTTDGSQFRAPKFISCDDKYLLVKGDIRDPLNTLMPIRTIESVVEDNS